MFKLSFHGWFLCLVEKQSSIWWNWCVISLTSEYSASRTWWLSLLTHRYGQSDITAEVHSWSAERQLRPAECHHHITGYYHQISAEKPAHDWYASSLSIWSRYSTFSKILYIGSCVTYTHKQSSLIGHSILLIHYLLIGWCINIMRRFKKQRFECHQELCSHWCVSSMGAQLWFC